MVAGIDEIDEIVSADTNEDMRFRYRFWSDSSDNFQTVNLGGLY